MPKDKHDPSDGGVDGFGTAMRRGEAELTQDFLLNRRPPETPKIVDQRGLPALQLIPANEGGFVVERFQHSDPRFTPSFDFAGSLSECLSYMSRRMTPKSGEADLQP